MNKKLLTFGIIGLFAMALVSAALVQYWGQVQVDMEVTEAVTVDGEECTFTTVAGGNYELCLFHATNNLGEEVDAEITLKVQKWTNGAYRNLADDEGILVGLTEDASYCFKHLAGETGSSDMSDITNCATQYEDWILQNADWMDWEVLTQAYEGGEYDTALITNHGGNSADEIDLNNGEITLPKVLPGDYDQHWVMYVDSAVGLEEGNYRVTLEVAPGTA